MGIHTTELPVRSERNHMEHIKIRKAVFARIQSLSQTAITFIPEAFENKGF